MPAMPVWRCPHCATPQAEASRCWVCRRSTTSCVTCRHYRRGISGGLGLCGLDPRHAAVADTDVRACWVGAPPAAADGPDAVDARSGRRAAGAGPAAAGAGPAAGGRAPRTFVPVEELAARRGATVAAAVAVLDRPPALAAGPATETAAEPGPVADRGPVTRSASLGPVITDPPRPIPGRWWLWGDPDPWPERLGERWA